MSAAPAYEAADGAAIGAAGALPAAGAGAAAATPVDSVRMSVPSETLSPTLTAIAFTTPSTGDGTSIVALSDSSVAIGASLLIASPTLTSTSMTGTSLKSPISGTSTLTIVAILLLFLGYTSTRRMSASKYAKWLLKRAADAPSITR